MARSIYNKSLVINYNNFLFVWYKQISLKVVDNLKCVTPTVMKLVKKNQKLHNSDLPFLVGDVKEGDVV